jgi:hypothetical protein
LSTRPHFLRRNPTDDGTPMSINVEMIRKTLMIPHHVAEVATPAPCRMVSVSDAFMPNGHTRNSALRGKHRAYGAGARPN